MSVSITWFDCILQSGWLLRGAFTHTHTYVHLYNIKTKFNEKHLLIWDTFKIFIPFYLLKNFAQWLQDLLRHAAVHGVTKGLTWLRTELNWTEGMARTVWKPPSQTQIYDSQQWTGWVKINREHTLGRICCRAVLNSFIYLFIYFWLFWVSVVLQAFL